MKLKTILALFALLLFLPSLFALEVTDSSGEERDFFSFSNPDVYVSSSVNVSNFSISYVLSNMNKSKTYNVSYCDEDSYCGEFSLLDLIDQNNSSFSGSTQIEIALGLETKTIFLDFTKPQFEITSSEILISQKKLNISYLAQDNSNTQLSILAYEKRNSSKIFLANISNVSNYQFDLIEEGNFTLFLEVFDEAQNMLEYEETFEVEDLFEPELEVVFLEKLASSSLLKVKFNDSHLSYFEIIKGTQKISDSLSGEEVTKEIPLTYTSGSITIRVFDEAGNNNSLTYSLDSSLSISFNELISNEKEFSFTSKTINSCTLLEFNSQIVSQTFSKSSTTFSKNLDVDIDGTYLIYFSCENENLKQYFTKKFIYDTKDPQVVELSYGLKDDGSIKLSWDESEEDAKYVLYRDNSKIYSGSKESFIDDEVTYPNKYSYYLEIKDLASNQVESQEISITPTKVNVYFSTSLEQNNKVEESSFSFEVQTDVNSNIKVEVRKNSNLIDMVEINNTVTKINEISLELNSGINEIRVSIEDEFGNIAQDSYLVTYSSSNVIEETLQVESQNSIEEPQESLNTSELTSSQITQSRHSSISWLWFFIILVFFSIFLYIIIFHEQELKQHLSKLKNEKTISKFSRKKDKTLESSLDIIKSNRAQKQLERQRELKRAQEKKQKEERLSTFEKKKLEDLKKVQERREEIFIPESRRKEAKKRVSKLREEVDENLKEIKVPPKKSFLEKIGLSKYKSQEVKEEKKDELSSYLIKKSKEFSWKNTKEYRKTYQDKLKEEQIRKELEKQQELEKSKKELEKKQESQTIKSPRREKKKKLDLDSYLSSKSSKRSSYFAQKEIDKELRKNN